MTLFGKILVIINFGFSVMLMAAALMFCLTPPRINWTDTVSKDPSVPSGELVARKNRVAELWKSVPPAELSWRDNRANVLAQEGYRAADRPWYDAELKHAQSLATAASPIREPVYKAGVLQLKEVNPGPPKHDRPLLVDAKAIDTNGKPGLPLASLEANQRDERKQETEWANQQKELQKLIDEAARLTEMLTPAVGKGLLVRIEDEKVKIKRADEELAIVRPLLFNTAVESELILRRREMLEARIKELSAALGVASSGRSRDR